MKRKLYFNRLMQGAMSLLAASLVVGCNVDEGYDLSNIDGGNIGIGTDDSSFNLPLATISIELSSLSTDSSSLNPSPAVTRSDDDSDVSSLSATDMLELMETIDAFLPSDLSGTDYEGGIDISLLGGDAYDSDYTSGLVELVLQEAKVDEEKCEQLCEVLIDNCEDLSYTAIIAAVESDLDVAITITSILAEVTSDVSTALNDDTKATSTISSSMTSFIAEQAADIETDYVMEEDLSDAISLDDGVLDILKSNLDGESNYIYLVSDVSHNIPMSVGITILLEFTDGTEVEIEDKALIDDPTKHNQLTADQIDMISNGMSIKAEIHINNYDPATGDLSIDGKVLNVTLVARKGGGITF